MTMKFRKSYLSKQQAVGERHWDLAVWGEREANIAYLTTEPSH